MVELFIIYWNLSKVSPRTTRTRTTIFKLIGPCEITLTVKNTCVGSCSVLPVGEVLILADLNEPPVLLLPRVPLRSYTRLKSESQQTFLLCEGRGIITTGHDKI